MSHFNSVFFLNDATISYAIAVYWDYQYCVSCFTFHRELLFFKFVRIQTRFAALGVGLSSRSQHCLKCVVNRIPSKSF